MKPITLASFTVAAVFGIVWLTAGCTSSTVSSNDPAAETVTSETTAAATAPSQAPANSATKLAVFTEEGVAIRGADPVAYFTQSAYVPGSSDFTYEWEGATWQFASAENRDLFASNPAQYAPQYGGFCAWAVSQGYTAPVDPTAWKVVGGKLYLNYDAKIQAKWAKDIPGNIAKADQNWPDALDPQ